MAHDITLGQIQDGTQKRDAIHIAVAPVLAYERLRPGQDIGFVNDDHQLVGTDAKHIGIVDPFLKHAVQPGQHFWMFLYPNTITSLRHDWTHPDFADQVEEAPKQLTPQDVALAKAWVTQFASSLGMSYDDLMYAADCWVDSGDYSYDNSESYKGQDKRFPIFWSHYTTITGVVAEYPESFFACSC